MPEPKLKTPTEPHQSLFSKSDLYLAFRKAKADLFHENFQAKTTELLAYEEDLDRNIEELFSLLGQPDWGNDERLSIKKLRLPKLSLTSIDQSRNNTFTNDGFSEWNAIDKNSLAINFRHIANAPIHIHVISALWIATVGERYDSWLSKSVHGSRVPRIGRSRLYNNAATSSFGHYPTAYRRWRQTGINIMRTMIEQEEDIVALTWDFSHFFENIDPEFIVTPQFSHIFEEPGIQPSRRLKEQHYDFTRNLVKIFSRYKKGLPIGISASAVFANILLREFDSKIEQSLTPLYYGRYMDDLFLVLKNPGRAMRTALDIQQHISQTFNSYTNLGNLKIQMDKTAITRVSLDEEKYASTTLLLNAGKQRYFIIDHHAGHDLINMTEDALEEISSERRLLPGRSIVNGASAHALTLQSPAVGDHIDLIGGSDTNSLRRTGLANILAAFRHFSSVFKPDEWAVERDWFCRACVDHVLPPHRIFELAKYMPKIVSMFVASKDWPGATKILRTVKRSLYYLSQELLAEKQASGRLWLRGFYKFMCRWILEEALAATPFQWRNGKVFIPPLVRHEMRRLVEVLRPQDANSSTWPSADLLELFADLEESISRIYWFDLGHISPTVELSSNNWKESATRPQSAAAHDALCTSIPGYAEGAALVIKGLPPHFLLFPTRRMSSIELSRIDPNIVLSLDNWRKANKFARSINWKAGRSVAPPGTDNVRAINSVNKSPKKRSVAVLSISTSDQDWERSIADPNDGRARYEQLAEVVNSLIQSKQRPDYALFPELSIPLRFADRFGHKLTQNKISSIMGVEYRRLVSDNTDTEAASAPLKVENNAHLYLVDNRLGYSNPILQIKHKGSPAIHEQEELRSKYNAALHSPTGRDCPVYYHEGVAFAVLICSELTNISYRSQLAGSVDILFVPSWNRDVTTFSALVESSTLDMHCYVAVANNRRFGDSRIRGPYKEDWRRDVVRLRGGIQDYFAVGQVLIEPLRAFQSNYVSPSQPFKPTPDGFKPAGWRKSSPWRAS